MRDMSSAGRAGGPKPRSTPGADQRRGRSRDMSSAGRAGGRSRINIDPHRLVRRERGRVLAGVAAGVGDTLGVAANVVRCGFLVLTLAGGLGVVLYGVGWLLMRSGDPDLPPRRTDAVSSSRVLRGGARPPLARPFHRAVAGRRHRLAAGGGDGRARAPLDAYRVESAPDRPEWQFLEHLPPETADAVGVLFGTRRGSLARIIAGAVCIVAGLAAFFVSIDSWRALAGRRDRRGRRARGLRADHRSRRLASSCTQFVARTSRAHPLRRARRGRRAPPRLSAADARARAAPGRRSARGRPPRTDAGA